MLESIKPMVPFLKWAGGKRWLVSEHLPEIPTNFNRYIEPFLGSGAVFFHLQPKNAILSDLNLELISAYEAIKECPEKVLSLLKLHHRNHNENYYYKIRSSRPISLHGKAAKFIYLNRTCWNGLYRVNLNGQFNVPKGTKKHVILDTDDFLKVSNLLSNTTILHSDFESVIDSANMGDFVFVDPPYTVNHNLNGFIKYNEKIFSWEDQIRLHDCLSRAKNRGVSILATNAAHPSIKNLYKNEFSLKSLNRQSVISSSPSSRGRFSELLIRG